MQIIFIQYHLTLDTLIAVTICSNSGQWYITHYIIPAWLQEHLCEITLLEGLFIHFYQFITIRIHAVENPLPAYRTGILYGRKLWLMGLTAELAKKLWQMDEVGGKKLWLFSYTNNSTCQRLMKCRRGTIKTRAVWVETSVNPSGCIHITILTLP